MYMAFSQMNISWLIEFRNKRAVGRVVWNPHNREGEAEEPQLWNWTGTQRQTLKQRKEERRERGSEGRNLLSQFLNELIDQKQEGQSGHSVSNSHLQAWKTPSLLLMDKVPGCVLQATAPPSLAGSLSFVTLGFSGVNWDRLSAG